MYVYRNYQNPNLIRYFQKYVSQMEVDRDFKPILVDILLRRAYEFDLTPYEIQTDMSTLMNSLKSIKIGKMSRKYSTAVGIYKPNKKEITLREDVVREALRGSEEDLDNLYVTLTHEVYHALARDVNGNDRLASINLYNGKRNSTLLEAIVETAADRTVFARTERDRSHFKKDTKGYPEMTFVVPVLAATYGVTEREFLKHAIMGRANLINFLAQKEREPYNGVAEILDGIELNLAKMHRALYGKKDKPATIEECRELISESMFAISYICNRKLEDRYHQEPIYDTYSAREFVENAKYNHVRLHRILDREMMHLNNTYGINIVPRITEMKEESEYDERRTIIDMDKVVTRRQNFASEAEFLRVLDYARNGALDRLQQGYLREKGIVRTVRQRNFSYLDLNVVRRFDDEDFPINMLWDNRHIQKYFRRNLPRHTPRQSIIDVAIQKITELTRPDSRYLPEEGSYPKEEKAPDYFKLSDDDLSKFNEGARKAINPNSKGFKREKPDEKSKGE